MSYTEALSELTNYPKALSHAGSGGEGDVSIKTLKIVNRSLVGLTIYINGAIIDGKYGAGMTIESGKTAELKYIDVAQTPPEEGLHMPWMFAGGCSTALFELTSSDENVTVWNADDTFKISVIGSASDNATVTFTDSVV